MTEIDSDANVAYHLYRKKYNEDYQELRRYVLELNQRGAGETTFVGTNDPDKGDMLSLLEKLIRLFGDKSDEAQLFQQLLTEATAGGTDCRDYYPHEYAKSEE